MAALADDVWLLPPPRLSFIQAVLAVCRELGFQPRTAYETANVDMAQPLVAAAWPCPSSPA